MSTVKKPYLSNLTLGGAAFSGSGGGYGFGEFDTNSALSLLARAIDLGVSSFDTAPIYGFGSSEVFLGSALRKDRDKIKIITKGGVGWHSSKRVNMSNEPKLLTQMLEDSLKRLNLDYIDTYLIHYPDPRVDIRSALEVLVKARERGDIKKIGLSNTNLADLEKAREICEIEVIQNECNLFRNGFSDIKNSLEKYSALTMGWGTLDKGILSSRVNLNRKYDDTDFRAWAPWWKKSNWKKSVAQVEKFRNKRPDIDLTHLALSYSLSEVDSIICGMKRIEDLENIISFLENPIRESNKLAQEFSRC